MDGILERKRDVTGKLRTSASDMTIINNNSINVGLSIVSNTGLIGKLWGTRDFGWNTL